MNILWIEDVLLDLAQCAQNESASNLQAAILDAVRVAQKENGYGGVASVTRRNVEPNVVYPEAFFPIRLKS